jgi:hypothetical protein
LQVPAICLAALITNADGGADAVRPLGMRGHIEVREQDVVAGFEEGRLKGHTLGPDVVKSTLPNWSVPVVNVMSPFVLKKASE